MWNLHVVPILLTSDKFPRFQTCLLFKECHFMLLLLFTHSAGLKHSLIPDQTLFIHVFYVSVWMLSFCIDFSGLVKLGWFGVSDVVWWYLNYLKSRYLNMYYDRCSDQMNPRNNRWSQTLTRDGSNSMKLHEFSQNRKTCFACFIELWKLSEYQVKNFAFGKVKYLTYPR